MPQDDSTNATDDPTNTIPAPRARGRNGTSGRKPSPRAKKEATPQLDPPPTALLDSLQSRRDEILASLADVEQRLTELQARVREATDLTAAQQMIVEAHQQATELRRDATSAAETFAEANRLMALAREDADAARQAVTETSEATRATREQADAVRQEVEQSRQEVEQSRRELEALEQRVKAVRAEIAAMPTPPEPQHVDPVNLGLDLPTVELVPPSELAHDAHDRLVRYLNDARATEHELAGLLQTLADSAADPTIRTELETHRATTDLHAGAVEERLRAMKVEPAGRGLLGEIVSRLWEAIEKPAGDDDEAAVVLKTLGAAELMAGIYLALHALARAIGDEPTANMASSNLRAERDFADRLRGRLAPLAARAARRDALNAAHR